jgi:hypothetical protein
MLDSLRAKRLVELVETSWPQRDLDKLDQPNERWGDLDKLDQPNERWGDLGRLDQPNEFRRPRPGWTGP